MEEKEYKQIIKQWKENNKELIESGKCKKVFTEVISRHIDGRYKGNINWKESIGYKIYFLYNDIEGYLYIESYNNRYLHIIYKNNCMDILDWGLSTGKIGKLLNKITSDFKVEIGQVFEDDRKNIVIIDRKEEIDKNGIRRKWYKYECLYCGFKCGEHYNTKKHGYEKELWMEESHLLNGTSCCACCMNSAIVKGINDIATTHSPLKKYFKNIEDAYISSYKSHVKIIGICPDCGSEKEIQISDLTTDGYLSCPKCGDGISYPNKFMFNLLEQLNVYFEIEYNPDWCKYLYKNKLRQGFYDFRIPSINKIIEMDGGFHDNDNTMNGQTKEDSKYIDEEKDKLAIEHGINKPIRINCNYDDFNRRFDYIKKSILNSDVSKLFNLNNINWSECEKFALSSRVKEVCELWNNGMKNKQELMNITKLSSSAILSYLRKCSELELCDYNSKIEAEKGRFKIGMANSPTKSLVVFKDSVPLKSFESGMELERCSEELFGVRFGHSAVSAVCMGKKPQYKGYTFKYLSDLTEEELLQLEQTKLNQAI